MLLNHIALLGFWMMFAFTHSIFANQTVKEFFQSALGDLFRFYRLAYSVMAFISLVAVLLFQYFLPSPLIFQSLALKYLLGIPFCVIGILIMAACIKKYFNRLSGIRLDKGVSSKLETEGLHKFVRHPLYLGTLIFIWSVFLIYPLCSNAITVISITGYVLIGTKAEENKLIDNYGKQYEKYRSATPALFPNDTSGLIRLLFS